jgi:hypothetical protein
MTTAHETGERPGPQPAPVPAEVLGHDETTELNRREEFQLAIETGTVTLDQVVEANFGRFHGGPSFYAELYPRLLQSFEQQHGGISRSYFARHTESAVVMTREKELFVKVSTSSFDDAEFIGILSKLTLLHLQAREFLNDDDFRISMDPVFSVITYCLQVIDRMTYHAESPSPLQSRNADQLRREVARQQQIVEELLRDEYARAEDDFYKVVQRNALVRYFYGMLAGVAALGAVAWWMGFVYHGSVFGLPNSTMATVLVAGAIGAFISVLTRMSSGRFSLSRGTVALQQAKRKAMMLFVLGAFRPIMGAVFAAAFVTFQDSGLIPIQPKDGVTPTTYYTGLAFIAGFSERWAQDMVVSTRTTLLEPRPSAGGTPESSSPAM